MLSHLLLTALFILKGHAINNNVEWGLEADRGKLALYCDGKWTSVTIPLNAHTEFIGHTHPDGTNPYPSEFDIRLSEKLKLEDLVVSAHAAYLVHPDGSVEKVG